MNENIIKFITMICSNCDKAFVSKFNLERHIKTQHPGEHSTMTSANVVEDDGQNSSAVENDSDDDNVSSISSADSSMEASKKPTTDDAKSMGTETHQGSETDDDEADYKEGELTAWKRMIDFTLPRVIGKIRTFDRFEEKHLMTMIDELRQVTTSFLKLAEVLENGNVYTAIEDEKYRLEIKHKYKEEEAMAMAWEHRKYILRQLLLDDLRGYMRKKFGAATAERMEDDTVN